jgi:hypothetical protein
MTNAESGAPSYDIAALRAQFPVTASPAYFDHATFGPPPLGRPPPALTGWDPGGLVVLHPQCGGRSVGGL